MWPMPVQTGMSESAMARATGSWSKVARSALEPPPRTITMTSTDVAWRSATAAATMAGASLPWTAVGATDTSKASSDPHKPPRKSLYPSVPGLATRPTRSGSTGTRIRRWRSNRFSSMRAAMRRARSAATLPMSASVSTSDSLKSTDPRPL